MAGAGHLGSYNPNTEDIEAYLFRLESFLKTKYLRPIQSPTPLAAGAAVAAVNAH